MKKVIIYLPKGQIANYVYTNYPDNLGFKVEDLEIVKKLKIKKIK